MRTTQCSSHVDDSPNQLGLHAVGRRHEIIDGDHYLNPAPATYHQRLSGRIHFQLYEQIDLPRIGEVYCAPTDVQLTDHDIVQPDLIVVLNERKAIITPTKIKGVPDLVVEILSESMIKNDRVLKKELYERVGIPEYWIVDLEEHLVDQFVLTRRGHDSKRHCQSQPGVVTAYLTRVEHLMSTIKRQIVLGDLPHDLFVIHLATQEQRAPETTA